MVLPMMMVKFLRKTRTVTSTCIHFRSAIAAGTCVPAWFVISSCTAAAWPSTCEPTPELLPTLATFASERSAIPAPSTVTDVATLFPSVRTPARCATVGFPKPMICASTCGARMPESGLTRASCASGHSLHPAAWSSICGPTFAMIRSSAAIRAECSSTDLRPSRSTCGHTLVSSRTRAGYAAGSSPTGPPIGTTDAPTRGSGRTSAVCASAGLPRVVAWTPTCVPTPENDHSPVRCAANSLVDPTCWRFIWGLIVANVRTPATAVPRNSAPQHDSSDMFWAVFVLLAQLLRQLCPNCSPLWPVTLYVVTFIQPEL